jgi:uncharacterized protein
MHGRKFAVVLTACAMAVSSTACGAEGPETGEELSIVEVSTVGMDMLTGSPVVLLLQPESGEVVPIWVGLNEAQAIARALHGLTMPRPMTHDLMGSMLAQLEVSVEGVDVHDLREGTYYGRVRLKRAGQEEAIEVDSRPSDALALALRTGAPVRVARKLLIEVPDFEFVAPQGPQQVVRILGITVVTPTPELKEEYNLPDRPGVVVRETTEAMEKRGLKPGDLIIEVNDLALTTPMDFYEAVLDTPRGEPIRLRLLRQDAEKTVEVPWDAPRPSPSPRREEGFRA